MSNRRPLSFGSLSEVMPEVDRLLLGYEARGRWSLGQVCQHLARTIRFGVEGSSRRLPWLLRRTVGRAICGRVLATGRMPEGIPAPRGAGLVPQARADDRAEAEALRATIRYFQGIAGPLPEHPFFGPLTREEWERLHCIHSAHHLSFLRPGSEGAREGPSMAIVIRESSSGAELARGESGTGVIPYEGNLYFDPAAVQQGALRVTERTYTCPYKGTCNWVDYQAADGRTVRDVAWVYPEPKPGHEAIRGRFGFYAGARGSTRQEGA
ncbi:hypothetical protein OJF2_10430 [Aquisphaera giovannonii]|uniref:DUF427 domain-containing protein n=1 Tax=Aquisphaera giovannonii TaxID=406548 RepID=A0A5B9VVT5_9BACT|nr:DUF1569 domain-containing protein [Aquisphaera giovannonii]QEH32566.1 hypothetical protein OJF2_10430 [Aquisphaera giovannonii]